MPTPSLSATAFAKETLLACEGYDANFVSGTVPLTVDNILTATQKKELPPVEGNKKKHLQYTNLSVLYNAGRRVPFVSAYNIDGSEKKTGIKRASSFKNDPRIDDDIQLDKQFYDLRKDITEFEIGHMAANNEMAWGDEAQLQSYQTFHFPNSAPQAERLNTGIWKTLETYIIEEAATVKNNRHISVFTGPVLTDNDPAYVKDKTFNIPLLFYKVVVFMTGKGLFSTGFIMSHEQKLRQDKLFVVNGGKGLAEAKGLFDDFPYKLVFQVNMDLLEDLTKLRFHWKDVTAVEVPEEKNQLVHIRKIKDAADARNTEQNLRKGIIPTSAVVESIVSDQQTKKEGFRLNMVLP